MPSDVRAFSRLLTSPRLSASATESGRRDTALLENDQSAVLQLPSPLPASQYNNEQASSSNAGKKPHKRKRGHAWTSVRKKKKATMAWSVPASSLPSSEIGKDYKLDNLQLMGDVRASHDDLAAASLDSGADASEGARSSLLSSPRSLSQELRRGYEPYNLEDSNSFSLALHLSYLQSLSPLPHSRHQPAQVEQV